MITLSDIRRFLEYNPETGLLTWLPRSPGDFEDTGVGAKAKAAWWNTRYAGKPALNYVCPLGYRTGSVFNQSIRAHRAAWALMTGEWPELIDHINGDRSDNRSANLRAVDPKGNCRNMGRPRHNNSGVVGVSWHSSHRVWRAFIKVNRRNIHLGTFGTVEQAIAARAQAEVAHGFHPNHGKRLATPDR